MYVCVKEDRVKERSCVRQREKIVYEKENIVCVRLCLCACERERSCVCARKGRSCVKYVYVCERERV